MELGDITGMIIDVAMQIHRELGPGLQESVYETLLTCELQRRGLRAQRQCLIGFSYNGVEIEDAFRADLFVEGLVIVEVKSFGEARAGALEAASHLPPPDESARRPAAQLWWRNNERRPETCGERLRSVGLSRLRINQPG